MPDRSMPPWQPAPAGQPYPGYEPAPVKPPKRRRRIFLWVFIAVQVLFLAWVISGAATASGTPSDCGELDAKTCNDASDVGTGIGVTIVVGLWFFVDLFLGVGYAVYRLARKP